MKEYNSNDFLNYLSNPRQSLIVDLSKSSLIQCIESMINVKNKMSPRYGKHFSSLLHNLRKIEKEFSCELMPSHVTDIFWCNFIPYLINEGIALSTVKTVCSQLKTTIEWSARHKAEISDTYDMLKIPPYCHQQIALTPDEVSHIYHFDISTISKRKQYLRHMEKVRDMFVLSCNLGQRFSDMVRIDRNCFDRNIFTILQQKTGTSVRVDIERMSIDRNTTYSILEKYGYKSPITTDISCYDKYVKQMLRYIGKEFNKEIKRETKINGEVEVEFIPKWKLVGSHTSRRTFITNNVLRGFPSLEIMRASGHKSFSSFEKYLCYFND